MATKHNLKTWPQFFQAVKRGQKTFEVRKADRPFAVGDVLVLEEWNPETQAYTGDKVEVQITYILNSGAFGLADDFCVLGFAPYSYRLVPAEVAQIVLDGVRFEATSHMMCVQNEADKVKARAWHTLAACLCGGE